MSMIMEFNEALSKELSGGTLRALGPHELALYLRRVSQHHSPGLVSEQLIEAIERGSLPPSIYQKYLTAVDSPIWIDGILQQHSRYVRRVAIYHFGRQFWSMPCKDTQDVWETIGGTEGLLSLLKQVSSDDVQHFCKAIGGCSRKSRVIRELREHQVEELVRGLLPMVYPASVYKSDDMRPLHRYYARLVPACSSQFVEEILLYKDHPLLGSLPGVKIVRHHAPTIQRVVLRVIDRELSLDDNLADKLLAEYLPPLIQSEPPLPSVEPKFSASMSFAETVLQKLASSAEARFPLNLSSKLMIPLLRRGKRRHLEPYRIQQIFNFAIQYYEKRLEDAKKDLLLSKSGVIFHAASYWSKFPTTFEVQLTRLLQLRQFQLPNGPESYVEALMSGVYQSEVQIFEAVKKSHRYALLQLLYRHSLGVGYDIESVQGLKDLPIRKWPSSTFLILDSKQGVILLQRLFHARPEGTFLKLKSGLTVLSHPPSPGDRHGDPKLLLILLSRGDTNSEERAREAIKTLKKTVAASRDEQNRAFFAKSVALYSLASGSLMLYESTIIWLRRFLGDFRTLESINDEHACNTAEGISLLTGMPESLAGFGAEDIRENILTSNRILMAILRSATDSLRQPSFNLRSWNAPLSLFRKVTMSRVSQMGRLKSAFQLSEDNLYDLVWGPTLKMLLEAEKIGVASEHASLHFDHPQGPLCYGWDQGDGLYVATTAFPSTYRFLDDLALSRDKLWQDLRPTWHPAVAALNPPFTRGLPIQCLTAPYNLAVDTATSFTPFIAARAEKIIMVERNIAFADLPTDEETRAAIGSFIDSFNQALSIYVLQRTTGPEREAAVAAASEHAKSSLSRNRLSEDETQLFWEKIFGKTLPKSVIPFSDPRKREDFPVIPTDIDCMAPTEWNPDHPAPREIKSRKLAPISLDSLLCAPASSPRKNWREFTAPEPYVHGVTSESMWDSKSSNDHARLPFKVQEGTIAAALLLASMTMEGSSRLLASPFPSIDDPRYPSLFLDEGFLQSTEKRNASLTRTLSHFTGLIPPLLLLQLTKGTLETLPKAPSASSAPNKSITAYRLLKLLGQSDRPNLASDLIIHTILHTPNDSSWHRQLLGRAFMGVLSPSEARALILTLTSSACEMLESQKQSTYLRKGEKAVTPSQPYIKVTTIKFLAQILSNADFLPPEFIVDTLIRLLEAATHIDIRHALIDGLLDRLSRSSNLLSESLTGRLFSALEAMVPVLGSLYERESVEETAWTKTERTGELPEVYNQGEPPLLNLVKDSLVDRRIRSAKHRKTLFERVLLPAIEQSKTTNTLWVRGFLQRYAPNLQTQSCCPPSIPVKPSIFVFLLRNCYNELPLSYLHWFHPYFLAISHPTPEIASVNAKVKEDMELRNSNAGKHWLSLYEQRDTTPFHSLPRILREEWKPSVLTEDGIELHHIQDLVFEQAIALLQLHDVAFTQWESYVSSLSPPQIRVINVEVTTWMKNCKPVLERLISHLRSLRSSEWQCDPNRLPRILPDHFRFRLWLLPYPQLAASEIPLAQRIDRLALSVEQHLRECTEPSIIHHIRRSEIFHAAMKYAGQDRVELALRLGRLDMDTEGLHESSLTEQRALWNLRVELAKGLLQNARVDRYVDEQAWLEVKGMIDGWKRCGDEGIVMRGWQLAEKLSL